MRHDRSNPLEPLASVNLLQKIEIGIIEKLIGTFGSNRHQADQFIAQRRETLSMLTLDHDVKSRQVPTMGELAPELNMGLWNGLFVTKDTPADVREKIIAVAKETVMSDRAQKVAADTGALVYWQDAEASAARIAKDSETFGKINGMLQ